MSEHFQPKEFASKDGKPSPYPLVVQQGLYDLLEMLREKFGKAIYINSGYRSPEHNAAVGGVKNSYHVQGHGGRHSSPSWKRLREGTGALKDHR